MMVKKRMKLPKTIIVMRENVSSAWNCFSVLYNCRATPQNYITSLNFTTKCKLMTLSGPQERPDHVCSLSTHKVHHQTNDSLKNSFPSNYVRKL